MYTKPVSEFPLFVAFRFSPEGKILIDFINLRLYADRSWRREDIADSKANNEPSALSGFS